MMAIIITTQDLRFRIANCSIITLLCFSKIHYCRDLATEMLKKVTFVQLEVSQVLYTLQQCYDHSERKEL